MTQQQSSARGPVGRRRPRTTWGALGALIALLGGGLTGSTLTAGSAEAAATQVGNDISWPQCAAPAGYGNPMPADATGFVVLGLTQGIAFTQNPCLADQARWIRDRSRPFQAYTMATYPTADQLAQYGSTGPFTDGTPTDALHNVGYAEAAYAVNSLRRIGLRPARVWIDVESRKSQPWPTGAAAAAGNVAILEGIVAGLKAAGFAAGFYGNASDWKAITGDWQSPDLAFWATVGTRGQATALTRCDAPGLNGGPVHLVQWWTTSPAVDWNASCDGHQLPSAPVTLSWPAAAPAWSLAASPGIALSAGPSRRQNWQVVVTDACTAAVRRRLGGTTSDLISARWDGQTDGGQPAGPGAYRLVLSTGTTSALTGPTFTSAHEIVQLGDARVGGCRVSRTAGADLYATAVETGKVAFPTATTAVIASGESSHLADAVTAGPYARTLRAPLLLTATATLPAVVTAELQRRGVRSVVIVGGPSAVAPGVVTALQALGITVSRVAGADRYATAALLAARIGGGKREIVVASGADGQLGYALVAGGPAAGLGLPILLTAPGAVPAVTATALKRLGAPKATVTVVGPTGSVSVGVQAALRARAKAVRRVAGTDVAGTATALTAVYAKRLGAGPVTLVNAEAPADQLQAGSLGRPILLTNTVAMPASTAGWVARHPRATLRIIGPPSIVATSVVTAIGR